MATKNAPAWIGPEDKKGRDKLLREVRELLIEARTSLNASFPFFGTLTNYLPDRIQWPEEWPAGAPATAYTDGDAITWCPFFVKSLNIGQICFVLEHEVMHVASHHLQRLVNRDPELWNIACDYVINATIDEANKSITDKACKSWEHPPGILFDPKYKDWSADDVYSEFEKNLQNAPGGGGCKGPQGQQQQGQQQGQGQGGGKGRSKEQVMDDIRQGRTTMQEPDPNGQSADGKDGDEDGGGSGTSQMSPAEREAMWNERLIRAATVQKGIGSMPAALDRLIDKVLKPRLDWKTVLAGLARSVTKNDISSRRYDRRWIGRGLYLPTLYQETLSEAVVIIDDSGSCYHDVPQFISEAIAIFDEFPNCVVRLVRCDTHPTHVCDWMPGQDDPAFEPNVQVGVGGGTSFVRPFSELLPEKQGEWNPQVVVYLTDLDGEIPGEEHDPGVPVLWVCTNDRHTSDELAFGELVYFDRSAIRPAGEPLHA